MEQRDLTERQATSVNDEMVRQMELRRLAQPERRKRADNGGGRTHERRRICSFCHQPGDHWTAAQCLRSLER
ncbi:MAG: hypothetical protein ABJC89_05845 [Acidobacteriota bacterium]